MCRKVPPKNGFIIGLLAIALAFTSFTSFADEKEGGSKNTSANKVAVEFYVMSLCPFGTEVENSIAPVLKKFGDRVEFSLDFIGDERGGKLSSMHGANEVNGDKVQLCAAKYNPAKYMDMILCMNEDPRSIPLNWDDCAKSNGLDVVKIRLCYSGTEGSDLLRTSYARAAKRRALGSPTMFINGELYMGPRSQMAFTRAICSALPSDPPGFCAELPEPVKFTVTIISDKRCKDCQAQLWKQRLKGLFPGARISILDYMDDSARDLYKNLALGGLPAVLFGREVEKADNYQSISRFLALRGEYYLLALDSRFDPTKEICDNKKDDTGNGLMDCKDPDCKNTLICREQIPRKLEVFVMSQCPYGVKALDAMKEVLENFKGEINFEVHYIARVLPDGTIQSLHGQAEVDEDMRELCAMKHYPKGYKWMDYVLCRNKNIRDGSWESCGKNGISTEVIRKCIESGEGKKLLAEDIQIAEGLGIGASPTWLANNKFKFSAIDAETVRKNICQHNKGMKNCDKTLSGLPLPEAEADCGH